MRLWLCYDVCHCEVHFPWAQATWIGECLGVRRRTTAFTCRAGCKERDVSKNRNAGPVKCNALFGGDSPLQPLSRWKPQFTCNRSGEAAGRLVFLLAESWKTCIVLASFEVRPSASLLAP